MSDTYNAQIGDSIKIHIAPGEDDQFGGESVWAKEMGNNTAEINNIPFFYEDACFKDIIRYEVEDGIREFKEVITKVTASWGVSWEPTDAADTEQTTEEWNQITNHLWANDVHYESAVAGMFVIALSVEKTTEEQIKWLKALKYSSPIALTLYLDED
jgi:hypothetical protein